MRASLPMYDWPELYDATNGWWSGLARHMRDAGLSGVPDHLDRTGVESTLWDAPDLMLSQTCGYPLTHDWADHLSVVAAPCYDVPGCDGQNYSSASVVRASSGLQDIASLRGTRAVINARQSLSGYLALQAVVAPLAGGESYFKTVITSGSHAASLAALHGDQADVCAIDAVVLAIARQYRPSLLKGLKEIAWSPSVPGLPYVTRMNCSADELAQLRSALAAAFADPSLAKVRQALFLHDIAWPERGDYDRVLELEDLANVLGYPAVF